MKEFEETLREQFNKFIEKYDKLDLTADILSGSPCVKNTRIPIYMILRVLAEEGSLQGVQEVFPQLTFKQIQEALRFSSCVIQGEVE